MSWADHRKMPVVQCGKPCFSESFDYRQHRRVDEAQWKIAVTIEKLTNPRIVGRIELDDL